MMFAFAFCATTLMATAQVKAPQSSPQATMTQVVGLTDVVLEYYRPSAKSRSVYGNLVPFGKVWRTGANGNSTISFSDDVKIDGKALKKGKYAIFTTPKADSWDVIFYTDTNNWGLPEKWDEGKVALRTTVKPQVLNHNVETFTMLISNLSNNDATLDIMWERTLVSVKFEVPTHATTMASIERAMNGPSANDYYAAGQYLYQSEGDMKKALEYVSKAVDMHKDKPFWMLRQKALIQAKTGDKKGAIETAKLSLNAAKAAKNDDYVKMNQDSINEWSK